MYQNYLRLGLTNFLPLTKCAIDMQSNIYNHLRTIGFPGRDKYLNILVIYIVLPVRLLDTNAYACRPSSFPAKSTAKQFAFPPNIFIMLFGWVFSGAQVVEDNTHTHTNTPDAIQCARAVRSIRAGAEQDDLFCVCACDYYVVLHPSAPTDRAYVCTRVRTAHKYMVSRLSY